MLKFFHDLIAIVFWGAHTARVQISAASPNPSDSSSSRVGLKVRDREDAIASTLQAYAPPELVAMVACQITGDAKAASRSESVPCRHHSPTRKPKCSRLAG